MEPRHYEFETPYGDHDSPLGPVVIASPEDLRRAEQLRQRVRDFYARRRDSATAPWCVGAD
jgi:hypothetical protein